MFIHESIGFNIFVIDKYFKMYLKNSLKEYNLNTAEGLVLLILYKQQALFDEDILKEIHENKLGKTQEQIIDELHYDKGVMTRTMKSLEDKKYVTRESNPNDSRSYIFKLTDDALDLKPNIIHILREWHNILLKDTDEEMIKLLKVQLCKMFDNAVHSSKT